MLHRLQTLKLICQIFYIKVKSVRYLYNSSYCLRIIHILTKYTHHNVIFMLVAIVMTAVIVMLN